jgi:signal transduction histidine kinase/PAS domain-containing protein
MANHFTSQLESPRPAASENWLLGKCEVLEMLARGEPLTSILERCGQLVEKSFEGSRYAVLVRDENRPFLRSAVSTISAPEADGIVQQIASLDANDEPNFQGALQTIWSWPLRSSADLAVGRLLIVPGTQGEPSEADRDLLDRLASLVALVVERSGSLERLRRSEEQLAAAQYMTSTGSFCWNAVAGVMTWSDETYRICEVDRSVIPTGDLTRDLFHPEDLHYFRDMIAGPGRDYRFECRLKLPSGIKHIQVAGVAERAADGRLREWVGTFMDISAQKKIADALRASEHLARGQVDALGETLTLMSRETDPAHIIEHVLRMICRQLDAHSLGVWEISEDGKSLVKAAECEGGKVFLPDAVEISSAPPMELPEGEHPIWTEFFGEGRRVVLGDLSYNPIRVRFADDENAPWHSWLSYLNANPEVAQVQQELADDGIVSTLCVPMVIAGKVCALISIRFQKKREFERGELDLAHALAHQATLALQLGRLSQQSKQMAVLAERNRLARDIHDTLAQSLTGIVIQIRAAQDAASRGLTSEAENHLVRAGKVAADGLREARRSVRALRPGSLKNRDLVEAVEEMFARMTVDTPLNAQLSVQGRPYRLDAEREADILRVSQEILTNALKHAHATTFRAEIHFQLDAVKMELSDNGRGFDPDLQSEGFGLIGIRERVENAGGAISLESERRRGTRISFSLPASPTSEVPA